MNAYISKVNSADIQAYTGDEFLEGDQSDVHKAARRMRHKEVEETPRASESAAGGSGMKSNPMHPALSGFRGARSARLSQLPFERARAFPTYCRVTAARVLEPVYVFEDGHLNLPACFPGPLPDQFCLALHGSRMLACVRVKYWLPLFVCCPLGRLRCNRLPGKEVIELFPTAEITGQKKGKLRISNMLIASCHRLDESAQFVPTQTGHRLIRLALRCSSHEPDIARGAVFASLGERLSTHNCRSL